MAKFYFPWSCARIDFNVDVIKSEISMIRNKTSIIFIISLFLLVFNGCKEEIVKIEPSYPFDNTQWNLVFKVYDSYNFEDVSYGVIVPHELDTATEAAKFYNGLSQKIDPSLIVIMGPNQSGNGSPDIQTCLNCIYEFEGNEVKIDYDFINNMISAGIATPYNETFIKEHSISSQIPFISNYFPNSKIVPIIYNGGTDVNKVIRTSDWLYNNMPDGALVIASVDFSHYQPESVADFHDLSAFATISNFDFNNIYDLEIDGHASLYALLHLMKKRGYMRASLINDINSADYSNKHLEETISYKFWAFYPGDVQEYNGVSLLSVGDIPQDSTLSFNMGWRYNEEYDVKNDHSTTRMLKDIKGRNDTFLSGTDFLVFDLLDNECFPEEQNGIKIEFCKFIENEEKNDEYIEIIKEKTKESDILYLLYEFQEGGELDDDRKYLIRDFVKKGVDIFVGRGFDDVIPFEIYKGSLIFYSLGDFIIDNKLITDLNAKSSGIMLGLYVTDDNYYLYVFPIDIINGYPKLKAYAERGQIFEYFKEEASIPRSAELDAENLYIKLNR